MVGSGSFNTTEEPTWNVSFNNPDDYLDWTFGQRDIYLLEVRVNAGSNIGLAYSRDLFQAFYASNKSADAEQFVATGGSTGGLWGFLPTTGKYYDGLIPTTDAIIFPVAS